MAATAHGATFTFTGTKAGAGAGRASFDSGTQVNPIASGESVSGKVTRLLVESPVATLVDFTGTSDGVSDIVLVPTGEWKGGSIAIDFISSSASKANVQALITSWGTLSFSSSGGYSISRSVVVESATVSAETNDVLRGSMRFLITDFTE